MILCSSASGSTFVGKINSMIFFDSSFQEPKTSTSSSMSSSPHQHLRAGFLQNNSSLALILGFGTRSYNLGNSGGLLLVCELCLEEECERTLSASFYSLDFLLSRAVAGAVLPLVKFLAVEMVLLDLLADKELIDMLDCIGVMKLS